MFCVPLAPNGVFFIVGYFKVVADSIELWERKTKISWNQTSRTEGSASKQTTYWPNLAVQTKARDEPQSGSLLVIDFIDDWNG